MSNTTMKNSLAILVSQKNVAQSKLVRDVPSMIDALSVMIENEIGSDSTQELCTSFGNGYVKYGRLTDKQLPVLKNVILQYAGQILDAMAGKSEIAEEESESSEPNVKAPVDEDPFA